MYLTNKNAPNSKPIAINTTTNEVIRLTEDKDKRVNIEPYDYLNEKDIKKNKKKMNSVDMTTLKRAFQTKTAPTDPFLKELYDEYKDELEDKVEKQFISYDGSYVLMPTPKKSDRIYIAGSTGVGKSTWIATYLKQFKKIYPDRKIFLFSDSEHDPNSPLDLHKPIRVKLNMALVDTPIQTPELANSVCIFDDCDSISDKAIKRAVVTLYDSILKKGSSKDNIYCIITNHAMSDYLSTRNILINSNFIVFFPQSPVGIEYTFKKFGLNKQQIDRLLAIPSRSCVLHKNYPFYVISDNTVALI
jgi:Cdc6-like AAA superfamily ATPase